MPTLTSVSRSRLAITSTAATMSGVASANSAATSARRSRRAAGPSVGGAPARPQCAVHAQPRAVDRRHQPPSKDRGAAADREHGQPAEHRRRRAGPRRCEGCSPRRRSSRARSPARRRPAPTPRRRGQHAALDEQVLQQPAARRAERAADRQLAAPVERARDEQVDGVRAGDEQHARRRRRGRRAASSPRRRRRAPSDPAGPTWPSRPGTTTSRSGKSRAFVARSASSAAARDTSGRRRPSTIVKNGPLRLGGGQRAAVNSATLCSSGPTVLCSTPTTVWLAPSIVMRAPEHGRVAPEAARPVGSGQHGHAVAARVVRGSKRRPMRASGPAAGSRNR